MCFSVNNLLAQPVVFNEIMSANVTTISDEDGEFPDWVEFYNAGPDTADLTGSGLSDDRGELYRWQFPRLSIAPREFQLIFLSGKDRHIWVRHWETVIIPDDQWAYHTGQSGPGTDWYSLTFNDQSWPRGPGGIGYGDGDDMTIIEPVISLYLRKTFTVLQPDEVSGFLLHIDYDDAFVAYLNGIEVARANIGTPGIEPDFNQSADNYREAEIYRGGKPERFDLKPFIPQLQTGENILAIQIHNYSAGSSDLSAIPYLTLGLTETPQNPRGMPEILAEDLPRLHTNFKLASDGEPLFLTSPDGQITDSISAVLLLPDRSFGRKPDGTASWVYFDQATPGSPNITAGYTGISQSPVPDRNPGFYPGAFILRITNPETSAKIFLTTDGSVPTERSLLYTGGLLVSQTMVLRCRSFEPGKLPSPVVTQTYFIGETQTLPVVSVSTEPANLWNEDSGIYVRGPNAESEFPYFGANFWQDWEKPVNCEFFESDGSPGFAEPAGMKITGAWSRGFPQKSLAVFFRGEYGNTSLRYRLFPGQDIEVYDEFILRNSGNDWGQTFMRDGFMTTLGREIGLETQAYRPVVLYLNGSYWGIHNMREKVNEDFLAAHHPVDPDNVDILEDNMIILEGDDEHYRDLLQIVTGQDISRTDIYTEICERMDIENFIDYMICEIYIGNTDWPGNNIKFWRPRSPEGRWRWIMFDTDFGFGLFQDSPVSHNTLAFATGPNGPDWPNPPWSTLLLRRLLENADFTKAFINRFADLLNTNFLPTEISAVISEIRSVIAPEIGRHLQRWELDPSGWYNKVVQLDTYARQRQGYMRVYLIQHFNLDGMVQVEINNLNPGTGSIRLNSISLEQESWQGAYFKNIPIQLYALPENGWRFGRWGGSVQSNANPLTYVPTQYTKITAYFVRDTSIAINELNYNSSPLFEVGDWVEFVNASDHIIDMSGWQFRDENDLHIYEFPLNSIIAPDSMVVICNDSLAFAEGFPAVNNLIGVFDFGLSAAGELIRLFDAGGTVVDSLTYDDAAPWPLEPDGQGATLALRDPHLDNSHPENWAASQAYGTPGKPNLVVSDMASMPVNQPESFSIGPAFPNPFNPATQIPINLPQGDKVTLRIYDMNGRMVERLYEDFLSAGRHTFEWHPTNLTASGVYFFTVATASGRKGAGKIILLR